LPAIDIYCPCTSCFSLPFFFIPGTSSAFKTSTTIRLRSPNAFLPISPNAFIPTFTTSTTDQAYAITEQLSIETKQKSASVIAGVTITPRERKKREKKEWWEKTSKKIEREMGLEKREHERKKLERHEAFRSMFKLGKET
jgi:hypothetical protein